MEGKTEISSSSITSGDEELARLLQEQYDEVKKNKILLKFLTFFKKKEYVKELQEEEEEEETNESEVPGTSELVVRFLDDLWNNRNFKLVDDLFSEDCVSHGSFGYSVGKNQFKTSVLLPLFNAFPDLEFENNFYFYILLTSNSFTFFSKLCFS